MKTINNVICVDIEGKTYQVPASELTFRPAVYGVIIKDNKILLSRQWDGYDFPGGGIELGESSEEALIREVKEETGFDISIGKIIHTGSSFFKMPFNGNFVHSIHLYFVCHITGGELSTKFFDKLEKIYAKQAEWIPLNQVENLKFFTSGKIEDILKNYKTET